MKKGFIFAFILVLSIKAQTIKKINFSDNKLFSLIPIKEGETLTPSLTKETVVNLYKTGLFYNVKVYTEKDKNGVIVNIETVPAEYFGEITTKGKIGIKKRRLKKLYREFYPFKSQFRKEKMEIFIKTLKEKFAELGYPDAKITYSLEKKDNKIFPIITIDCGKPLIVQSIKTNNKKLYKKFVKIREKDVYNKELFLHGIKKMRNYLQKNHYLNSKIKFREKIENGKVKLTIIIKKGKKFRIESENIPISEDNAEELCAFLKTGRLNDATIKITEKNLYFKALQLGYDNPKINIEVNKEFLKCRIENPSKKEIKKIAIECDIPIKLTKKFKYYNKLTKSEIYSEISEKLSKSGYLKPKIKFDYNSASKTLKVKVNKGILFRIGEIKTNSDIKLPENIYKNIIRKGEVFDKKKITDTITFLKSYLLGEGYFNPEVNIRIGRPSEGLIPLSINIKAGKKIILSDIVVLGNKKIKTNHILKFASFSKGDVVCKPCIEEFKTKLEFSGFFSLVKIDLIQKENNKAVLLVKVRENKLYSFSYAVGINSDEGLRFTAKIKKKYLFNNFFNGTTIFRISTKRTQGYFTVSGKKHFLSSIYFTIEDKDDYKFSRFGFSFSYAGNILSHTRIIESLEFTKNNLTNIRVPIEEIDKDLQPDYTIGLKNNILYDKRNDILFPTKGFFINANIFPAYVVNDDKFFLKANVKTGIYFKNFEIITNIGKIFTKNDYQIPIPQRFFAGGSTNLRISSFEQAGPLFSTGVPKGGNFMFVFSAEYKYHLTDIYYLTFFTDIGNVWENSSDFSFESCIKDAGIGLMVKTPIGPIKIQLAKNLDKDTFPSNLKLVFSLGATF